MAADANPHRDPGYGPVLERDHADVSPAGLAVRDEGASLAARNLDRPLARRQCQTLAGRAEDSAVGPYDLGIPAEDSGLGRPFDDWFARSCDRVPERRFASAAAQAAALARALEGLASGPAGHAAPHELDRTVTQRTSLGMVTAEEPPAPLSARPLVGRDAERHELIARLLAPGALVTVTGAAGTGKTRLAESVAAELGETFPGGAWWV